MICPKCKKRLQCVASYCKNNTTARRYRCKDCGLRLHTLESPGDRFAVNELLNEGTLRYKK